jgi:flagellar FliJ protein
MKFVFTLEVVLKQKKRIEEMAMLAYVEAQRKVDESQKRINQMWEDIQIARESRFKVETNGSRNFFEMSHYEEFVVGHKQRIELEKKNLRQLLMVAEEKKELLVEAAKEYKAIQKLKEKKKEEFKKYKNKIEVKKSDDIVNNRFKRST